MDDVTRMEGLEDINAGTNARSGPDAAATKKEVANQAVAALSRRVSGGGKTRGMLAGCHAIQRGSNVARSPQEA